ncbi:hypothetical protein AAG570_002882 [Ranatra chinensis]|uniref:BHLH domain-containing protein n=1 Tax=Ranatra chinensis TaxID=642074 RepID=A0ABD0Y5L4_9HEMI
MASAVGKPLGTLARSTVLVENTEVRCKRRINFAGSNAYQAGVQPASVARRNARERNRVKQVNNGFATLRNHIPVSVAAALGAPHSGRGSSKKLSKVETLRMAVEYIRSLQDLLDAKVELSPPTSEASCSPPPPPHTPYAAAPGYPATPASALSHQPPPAHYTHQDNYEPMSPEDEELLDVISWWQQSQ